MSESVLVGFSNKSLLSTYDREESNKLNNEKDTEDIVYGVYYVIPSNKESKHRLSFSESSIYQVAPTLRLMPIVLKEKDETILEESRQRGRFVHPHPRNPNATDAEFIQNERRYAVGYAATSEATKKGLRIVVAYTDPVVRQEIVKDDSKIPKYLSVMTLIPNSELLAAESNGGVVNRWTATSAAIVDYPAFDKTDVEIRGICKGSMESCITKLKGFSEVDITKISEVNALTNSCGCRAKQLDILKQEFAESSIGKDNPNSYFKSENDESKQMTEEGSKVNNDSKSNSSSETNDEFKKIKEAEKKKNEEDFYKKAYDSLKKENEELKKENEEYKKIVHTVQDKQIISEIKEIIPYDEDAFGSKEEYQKELEKVLGWKKQYNIPDEEVIEIFAPKYAAAEQKQKKTEETESKFARRGVPKSEVKKEEEPIEIKTGSSRKGHSEEDNTVDNSYAHDLNVAFMRGGI